MSKSMTGTLTVPIYKLSAKTLEGQAFDFASLKNHPVLITNVACACGYTASNYSDLVALDAKYKGDLKILAFPSNEFGGQESGSPAEIRKFVDGKGVKFAMMEKTEVNGPSTHPVYKALKEATKSSDVDVKWNFESTFLCSRDGVTCTRLTKSYNKLKLDGDIEKLISAAAAPRL